jgi:hypothetical protein
MPKTLVKTSEAGSTSRLAARDCVRCGVQVSGQYCSGCGESAPSRLTVRGILRDFSRKVARIDFNLPRTLLDLARKPGHMLSGYLLGLRSRYTNPIGYLFLSSTAFIVVNSWLNRNSDLARIFDPFELLSTFWPYAIFALIVPGAALHRFLFRKRHINFAESYTTALYLVAQIIVLETALLPLTWRTQTTAVRIPLALAEAAYVAWAVSRLHDERGPSGWLRGVLVFAGYAAGVLSVVAYIGLSILSAFK